MFQERQGNLWTESTDPILCVNICLNLKNDGRLTMGKGQAKEALNLFPGIDKKFGQWRKINNSNLFTSLPQYVVLPEDHKYATYVVGLPTKYNWWLSSDITLIFRSLRILATMYPMEPVSLARPGVGLGGLNWESQVKPICKQILNDNFTIWYK